MRARRFLVAVPLALAPALQTTSAAVHPHLHGEILDVVAADPTSWQRMHLLAALAAMGYLLALPALAALPRRRGALLATVGAVVAVLGSLCLAVGFVAEAHMLTLLAQSGLEREAALALSDADEASLPMRLIGAGLPLAGIGQLLLAVGLIRSRAVARWKLALVVAGLLTSLPVPVGNPLAAVLMGMAVIGYVALTVDVVRGPCPERAARTDDEDTTETAVEQPVGQPVSAV